MRATVRAPGQAGRKAINLAPREPLLATERANVAFFETLPVADRARVDFGTVRGAQSLQPLFEFSGNRIPLSAYTQRELRYRALGNADPAEAERLAALARQAVDQRWDTYEEMASRGPAQFPADARKALASPPAGEDR
jgi:hypothetical protein